MFMSRTFKRARALEYRGRSWLWNEWSVKDSMKILYKFMSSKSSLGNSKKHCKTPTKSTERLQRRHLKHISSKVEVWDMDEHLDNQEIAKTTNRKKEQSCYWYC